MTQLLGGPQEVKGDAKEQIKQRLIQVVKRSLRCLMFYALLVSVVGVFCLCRRGPSYAPM